MADQEEGRPRIICADVRYENGEVVHMLPGELREALRNEVTDQLNGAEALRVIEAAGLTPVLRLEGP